MPNLLQRVRKLETRLNEASGLVPHSEQWFTYWERIFTDWTDALLLDPSASPAKPFPPGAALAIADRIIAMLTPQMPRRMRSITTRRFCRGQTNEGARQADLPA